MVITQLVQDNTGMSPEVPLNVLKFWIYGGSSRDSEGTSAKNYGL